MSNARVYIANVVGSVDFKTRLDLLTIMREEGFLRREARREGKETAWFTDYRPALFPGLALTIRKHRKSKATLFSSGKATFTSPSTKKIKKFFKKILFQKMISWQSAVQASGLELLLLIKQEII